MKKNYISPEAVELLRFNVADVITLSFEDPMDPANQSDPWIPDWS